MGKTRLHGVLIQINNNHCLENIKLYKFYLPFFLYFFLLVQRFSTYSTVRVEGYCCMWSRSDTLTLRRIPLDGWSARRRGNNNHKKQTSKRPAGVEPPIPPSLRPRSRGHQDWLYLTSTNYFYLRTYMNWSKESSLWLHWEDIKHNPLQNSSFCLYRHMFIYHRRVSPQFRASLRGTAASFRMLIGRTEFDGVSRNYNGGYRS